MGKMVGIMSMQRIINYGSFLQAYGLKSIIEQRVGCNVEFIDYRFGEDITTGESNKFRRLLFRLIINRTPGYYFKKKHYCKEQKKALIADLKSIGVDDFNYNTSIDTLVIGSDEVFNCIQSYPVGYSKDLFGNGHESCRVISYAASFGYTKLADLHKYRIAGEISAMLGRFKAISVRDENSYSIVKELTGKESFIHLDPVLIYDFAHEMDEFQVEEDNYIIVYAYTGRLSVKEECYIKRFAKRINKKIISIGNYCRIADKNIICNPLYIFSYFQKADYIVTDTFHGTILSIKTNSKFCTIIRNSNRNKISALLKTLGRIERVVECLEDIERLYYVPIDYTETKKIIDDERKKTIQYLKDNI